MFEVITNDYRYTMPASELLGQDYAANLAQFLLENTGSVCGIIVTRIRATDQRKLFGRFLGRGSVEIDGDQEEVVHRYTSCYGQSIENTGVWTFRALQQKEAA